MNVSKSPSCWTCRLRKKKCDKKKPTCETCTSLEITCYFNDSRPEWMDDGDKQNDMARQIRAEVKQGAEVRRQRQYVQVFALPDDQNAGPGVPESQIDVGQQINYGSGSSVAETTPSQSNEVDGSNGAPFSGSPASTMPPVGRVNSDLDLLQGFGLSNLTLDYMEVDFTITYLDYVFPFLFPFYRPSILEGGRSWLLVMLKDNSALFHTAMSLSTYFFTLILSQTYGGLVSEYNTSLKTCECKQHVWQKLASHMDTAMKVMQQDMEDLNTRKTEAAIFRRARVLESIVQLLVFEIAMARTVNWDVHLVAATALLNEIFENCGTKYGQPDLVSVITAMQMSISWNDNTLDHRVWNPDQGAFRFFVAILLYADIVASTSLEILPRLQRYHTYFIANDDDTDSPDELFRMEKFVGCQGRVIIIIGEIAALDYRKKEFKLAGVSSHAALVCEGGRIARSLEQAIINLENQPKLPQKISFTAALLSYCQHDGQSLGQQDGQILTTSIWAHAAEIYLTVVRSGWQPEHPKIRESVKKVLHLLGDVSPSTARLRNLVWPLCVSGCLAAVDQEQEFRDIVRTMGLLSAFGVVGEALRIMEQVWSMRDELDREIWDLAQCFRVLGSRVLLI
ncbi:hypothetical protein ABW20_dc0108384 [Dactylellina cionopaga]|nr:hypothetical protein ABW20_dc0108384 [Dactylellina cionopaga]